MPTLNLPADPNLDDLTLAWEAQYWGKKSWLLMSKTFERWKLYFGEARRPRDIFRSDVAEYKDWLRKKGWSDNSIVSEMERLRRFYRLLDELELVEKDFNPATGMSPKRIRRPR